MHRGAGDAPTDMDVCLGCGPERLRVAGVIATETRAPVQAEVTMADLADAFRKTLQPFGLDKFVLSNEPDRKITLDNGRVLAEFRTMPLVVWYPQKLNEMAAAGLDVVVYRKKIGKSPPVLMYYVRSVQEISGGNYGNQ